MPSTKWCNRNPQETPQRKETTSGYTALAKSLLYGNSPFAANPEKSGFIKEDAKYIYIYLRF